MRLICMGISYKTAPVALREKFALNAERQATMLAQLKQRWPQSEFAVISTCNRTEFYLARAVHGHPREEELRCWLSERFDLPHEVLAEHFYTLSNEEAVRHLCGVTSGLESQILGEDQIVSQIKESYARAVERGTAQTTLGDLFQTALHTAKHIRSETHLASGKLSVASIAAETVRNHLPHLSGRAVLAIGSGQTMSLLVDHLPELADASWTVFCRTPENARGLMEKIDATVHPLEKLGEHLANADILLCAMDTSAPILTESMIRQAQRQRGYSPMLIVDISVPRLVESAVAQIEGVRACDIDDLRGVANETRSLRSGDREKAAAILDRHVEEFTHRLRERKVASTIEALYQQLNAIADSELQQAAKRLSTHADVEEDLEILKLCLHRTLRQIVHPVVAYLKQQAHSQEASRLDEVRIRQLLNLDAEESPPEKPSGEEP